jgi:hypothetical protein
MNPEYKTKPVLQYTLQGILIKRYESISEVARKYILSDNQYRKLCTRVDSAQPYLNSYWWSPGNLPWTKENNCRLF